MRTIKLTTKLQQTQVNKIIKRLEGRKLIKAVKSIAFKNRRMYMCYDLGACGCVPLPGAPSAVWVHVFTLHSDVAFNDCGFTMLLRHARPHAAARVNEVWAA